MSDSISITIEEQVVEVTVQTPTFVQINLLEPVILESVSENTTHRLGDGSDHSDVADNTVHRGLTNNPHAVTALQVGADPAGSAGAVQGNLDTHEADVDNPHQVVSSQVAEDVYDNGVILVDTILDWANGQVQQVRMGAISQISATGWDSLAPVGQGKAQKGSIIILEGDLFPPTFPAENQGPLPTYIPGFANLQKMASLGPDGDIYSMWQVSNNQHIILESNVIVNGDFAADTDWAKGPGWIIAGDVASQTGSAFSELIQDPVVASGEDWFLDYDVTAIDGTVRPLLGGQAGLDRLAIGSYSEKIVSGAINTYLAFSMKNVGAKTCSIDNVVLRKGL